MPTTPLDQIIEKYGPAIEERARRIERRFAARSGKWGFGFEAVHWEDIQQRVYETLSLKGITVDDIDRHPEPLAYLYKMCEHKALSEAKNARAFYGTMAFTAFHPDDEKDTYGWVGEVIASPTPTPEAEVLAAEFDGRVRDVALNVIANLSGQAAKAIELWALGGNEAKEVAAALDTSYGATTDAIRRGLVKLADEEVATLHAVRAYLHPEAKKPKSAHLANGATPTALLELIET